MGLEQALEVPTRDFVRHRRVVAHGNRHVLARQVHRRVDVGGAQVRAGEVQRRLGIEPRALRGLVARGRTLGARALDRRVFAQIRLVAVVLHGSTGHKTSAGWSSLAASST
jgi:hypothetical protein